VKRLLLALVLAGLALPAFAGPYTHRSTGTIASNTNGAALNPGAPAGLTAGDLMILRTCSLLDGTAAEDTGWTNIYQENDATTPSIEVWARIADGGANDAATVDWSGADDSTAWISAYSGDEHTDLGTIVSASTPSSGGGQVSDLSLGTLDVTVDNTLVDHFACKAKTATSNDATTLTAPTGGGTTKRAQVLSAGNGIFAISSDVAQTTATDHDGSNFTRDGTNEAANVSGISLSLLSASAAPTFLSAPAIGTRTPSTIPINATSDTTGTMHGVAVTDGSGAPTCDAIEAETATGEYLYFHEAVVATVADTGTFSSYTDGTVKDGYFCIEDGSGNDSAVASIADMFKIPAFATPLTIASQTDTTYTTNSKVLDGAGTVDLVACALDASAPSVAQTNAGTGGCIISGSEDDATGTMTLDPSGATFPAYDLYDTGAYGGQVEAAVHALLDEFLDVPAEKDRIDGGLTSVVASSPYFGQGVAAGDIPTIDEEARTVAATPDPTGFPVTQGVNGTVSYDSGGSSARRFIVPQVYDRSSPANLDFLLVYGDLAPIVGDGCPFKSGSIFELGTNPDTTFAGAPCTSDPEGDTITYSEDSGTPPTDYVLSSAGVYSDGIPGACGHFDWVVSAIDPYGAETLIANEVDIGPLVPDVADVLAATAVTTIEATCSLTAVEGSSVHHPTIAVGNVVSTNPAIGTLVVEDQEVSYSLSLGPSTAGDTIIQPIVKPIVTQPTEPTDTPPNN